MKKKGKSQKAYVGRGAPQRFVKHSIVKATGTVDRKPPFTGYEIPLDELGWTMVELNLSVLRRQRLKRQYNKQRHNAIVYLQGEAVQFIKNCSAATTSLTEQAQLAAWYINFMNINLIENAHLAKLVMDAAKLKNQERHSHFMRVRSNVSKWAIKALTGSAKAGHKYLKETSKPLDYIASATGIVTEPRAIMSIKEEAWTKQWRREHEDLNKVKIAMRMLKQKAIEARGERHDMSQKELKTGIKYLRNNRSLGGDFWSPKEVKELEDPRIESLKDLLNKAERTMAAPAQALMSIIPLLQKPQGGDRPVVLASLFYVIWSAVRNPDIHPWESSLLNSGTRP